MNRFQYLSLMGMCVLATLPLEIVLGARVYRQPHRLVATLAIVAVPVFVWDLVAIDRRHWWFSTRYTTGWLLPGSVPVEELVFFVVIPLCTLLTHGAVQRIVSRRRG